MIPAPNVLLLGPTGSGKTTSLRTLAMAGIETAVLFYEPHMEVVADVPCPYLHYHYIRPAGQSIDQMLAQANTIATTPWEILSADTRPINGTEREQYTAAWIATLQSVKNFTCDRCGAQLGDVTTWGYNRAFAVDGLSGINKMVERFLMGGQIQSSHAQVGLVMRTELELFGEYLPLNTWCTYILIAHMRMAYSKATGEAKFFPHAVGQANVADWARNFNDVIRVSGTGGAFTWSTAAVDADVKGRNLPIADGLPQDFGPLLRNWWQRAQHTVVNVPRAGETPAQVEQRNIAAAEAAVLPAATPSQPTE